jgi:hypothetical protein
MREIKKVCYVWVERLLRVFMASRRRYVAKCNFAGKRKKKRRKSEALLDGLS